MTIGVTGVSMHTAQTRLLLTATFGGSGLPANVTLPFYIELAPATARLASLTCTVAGTSGASATLGVTAGLVDGEIGTVSNSDFASLSAPPTVTPATLINALGVVRVTGQAHATLGNLGEVLLSFSSSDIQAAVQKRK